MASSPTLIGPLCFLIGSVPVCRTRKRGSSTQAFLRPLSEARRQRWPLIGRAPLDHCRCGFRCSGRVALVASAAEATTI